MLLQHYEECRFFYAYAVNHGVDEAIKHLPGAVESGTLGKLGIKKVGGFWAIPVKDYRNRIPMLEYKPAEWQRRIYENKEKICLKPRRGSSTLAAQSTIGIDFAMKNIHYGETCDLCWVSKRDLRECLLSQGVVFYLCIDCREELKENDRVCKVIED